MKRVLVLTIPRTPPRGLALGATPRAAINLRLALANRPHTATTKQSSTASSFSSSSIRQQLRKSTITMARQPSQLAKQMKELGDTFRSLDKDESGYLTKDEVQEGLKSLGLPANSVDDFFRENDRQHDGKISYKEFVVYMSKKK